MLGATHGASGAVAGLAIGLLAPSPTLGLMCGAVGWVASWGPDLDHPASHGSKRLGPVSMWLSSFRIVRWVYRLVGHRPMPLVTRGLRWLSRAFGLPAHRGVTHTVAASVVAGLLAVVLAQILGAPRPLLVGTATTAGYLSALLGDWMTKASLPHLWFPWDLHTPGPPRWMRIKTGGWVELVLILPLLVVGALVLGGMVVAG